VISGLTFILKGRGNETDFSIVLYKSVQLRSLTELRTVKSLDFGTEIAKIFLIENRLDKVYKQ
jgi:hypothetical protein